MEETALRPVKMKLDIYGSGNYDGKAVPFPNAFICDALSQNILYHCYEKPSTVEELAKRCGVPAYYVEDRIDDLLRREAVTEVSRGRYQTDFIIWFDKYGAFCEENAEKALLPVMDRLIAALRLVAADAVNIDFYRAEKSEADLLYLYGVLAFDYLSGRYCKLPYPEFKIKYDGNAWNYIGSMETGKHQRIRIGVQHSANLGSRGHCTHTTYCGINGIRFRRMMSDTVINACEDLIFQGISEDTYAIAEAIKEGYVVKREDGSFFVTVPCFTAEQKQAFNALTEKHFAPIVPAYAKAAEKFIYDYKKLFPKHLNDDVDRMCRNMFFDLYATVVSYAQRNGLFAMPSKHCHCDVMLRRAAPNADCPPVA